MLISPLNAFPWVLNGLVEAWVSLKRVQEFIVLKDLDLEQYYSSNAGIKQWFCFFLVYTMYFNVVFCIYNLKQINDEKLLAVKVDKKDL